MVKERNTEEEGQEDWKKCKSRIQGQRQIDAVTKLIKVAFFLSNRIGLQPSAACAQQREINNLSARLVTHRFLTSPGRLIGILTSGRHGGRDGRLQKKIDSMWECWQKATFCKDTGYL